MDLEILKIAADTKNNKQIKNFTHKSNYKNRLCGDEMEISIIVKNKKGSWQGNNYFLGQSSQNKK